VLLPAPTAFRSLRSTSVIESVFARPSAPDSNAGKLSHLTLISFEVGLQLHPKHAWPLVVSSFACQVTFKPLLCASCIAVRFICHNHSGLR
jgi:hypothetical protein